jgi:hypothetical protein
MGRTPGYFFLMCGLTFCAAAQTNNNIITQSVYPSVGQPTSGAVPLPAPPEMALPGSGTPVGTPPNVEVNNAASGGGGAIVQPGISDMQIGGQPLYAEPRLSSTPVSAPLPAAQNVSGANNEIASEQTNQQQSNAPAVYSRRMANGSVGAQGQPMSLGEVAAQIRGRKPLAKRTFDNNDILALSQKAPNGLRRQSEDLPQSDQPVTTTPKQEQRPKNQSGALDQNDLRKVQEALRRSKQNQNSNTNPK